MIIGVIGVGKMASAIIAGLKTTEHTIIISGSSLERSQEIAKQLDVTFANSHQDLIAQADVVLLGIKPQLFDDVLTPLKFHQPVISMAAGITLERLAVLTNTSLPLIRIMPNINAQILQSTTAICPNLLVTDDLLAMIIKLCQSFGSYTVIEEKDFDTFTALAGSTPAYIALFIEALTKAGVKNGMDKATALAIVNQTMQATVTYLSQNDDSPHDMIDKICSPGGATITGLMVLEEAAFTAKVCSAIDATIARAKTL